MLLVDASNAFISLNRLVALHNIRRLCPPLATILINTYRAPTELFVDGDVILSQEGTTQGDPLAMHMYALATIPLIMKLEGNSKQIWFADDAAAVGKITDLREWWDRLDVFGPGYGYFPSASKTWLVTKKEYHAEATSTFAGTGVNVTSDGRPHLGAAIGSWEFVTSHVNSKVNEWLSSVKCLAAIARTQPHAAFSAITHGLMSKWIYLSRTTPDIGPLLKLLNDALRSDLLTALTGRPPPSDMEYALFALPARLGDLLPALTGRPPPSDMEYALFALPARPGGLGIGIPSRIAPRELHSSLFATSTLCNCILSQYPEYGYEIVAKQLELKALVRQENNANNSTDADEIFKHLPQPLQRAMDFAKEKGSSTWLTTLPLAEHGFTLHKGEFHDALALRYGWAPSEMPSTCTC